MEAWDFSRARTRKKQTDASAPAGTTPIRAFWDWWAESGDRIDPTKPSAETDLLGDLVAAVHPDLSWHFGPGREAAHRLTVSAGGNPEVRPFATRWHRAAPAGDETWEFAPAVEADTGALGNRLQLGGSELDLSEIVFDLEVSENERRVHVGVHHPRFGSMDEDARMQVAFLVLDWVLGEDDLERWVGAIDALVDAPAASSDGEALRRAVARLAADREPDGWAVLQGQDEDGRMLFAVARTGVRWIDRPALDLHHLIAVAFREDEQRQPIEEASERLAAFEDELVAIAEPAGLFVARQTSGGVRLFHLYTDSEDQNAADRIARFAADRGVHHSAAPDPGWREVRSFTG